MLGTLRGKETMPKFIVHLYPVVRVKLKKEIEADTYEEAVEKAEKYMGNFHDLFDDEKSDMLIEDGEEQAYALVDVVGDEEFKQTRWVHLNVGSSFGPQLLEAFRDLVTWGKHAWLQKFGDQGNYPQPIVTAHDLMQKIEADLKAQKAPPPEETK
jgi:hypothetical protein